LQRYRMFAIRALWVFHGIMRTAVSAALAAALMTSCNAGAAGKRPRRKPTFVGAVTAIALAAAAGKAKLPRFSLLPVRTRRARGAVSRGDLPSLGKLAVAAVLVDTFVTFLGHPGPALGLRLTLVFLGRDARLINARAFSGEKNLPPGLVRFAELDKALAAVVRGLGKGSKQIWFNSKDAKRCARNKAARPTCQRLLKTSRAAQPRALEAMLRQRKGTRRFLVGTFGEVGPLALDAQGKSHYIELDIVRQGKGFLVELIKVK